MMQDPNIIPRFTLIVTKSVLQTCVVAWTTAPAIKIVAVVVLATFSTVVNITLTRFLTFPKVRSLTWVPEQKQAIYLN